MTVCDRFLKAEALLAEAVVEIGQNDRVSGRQRAVVNQAWRCVHHALCHVWRERRRCAHQQPPANLRSRFAAGSADPGGCRVL